MDYSTAENDAGTNAEQTETGDEFRVSYESVLSPESEERLRRKKCFQALREALSEDERLMAGSVVYFIAGAGLIKIGTSTNVRSRFCAIKNSSPVSVSLLAVMKGDYVDEMRLHSRFTHLRRHGEWFTDTPELREAIVASVNWGRPLEHRIKRLSRITMLREDPITPKQEGPR